MIFEAPQFVFTPETAVSRARRILIKPCAGYPLPHPVTTSYETISRVIEGIRHVSDADILILEGTPTGGSVYDVYKALSYDFPRVLMLDAKDCIWVEVENPLPHFFALPTFWVPNVVLSSDYLISISPFKSFNNVASLTIANLLSLLPVAKYQTDSEVGWDALYKLGIEKVLADLYFTVPFDMGVIDARKRFVGTDDPTRGEVIDYGKIFSGEPWAIDREAAQMVGLRAEYLDLIEAGRVQLENEEQ
jgi:uncharacterized protein (DUF362 family)